MYAPIGHMWCRQAIRQENTEGKGTEVFFVLKTVFAILLEMSRAASHKALLVEALSG
jgi:hypothetical protein